MTGRRDPETEAWRRPRRVVEVVRPTARGRQRECVRGREVVMHEHHHFPTGVTQGQQDSCYPMELPETPWNLLNQSNYLKINVDRATNRD
jgi:hypothetical protein